MSGPLPRSFFERSALDVAPALLGTVVEAGGCRARVVEVEAYLGADDAASHAYRGPTRRNATMFGPAGHLYVYFTYGMHWCANVVTATDGVAQAVLLRAVEPLDGIDAMRARRPAARRDADLTNGPAKLCQALGIDGSFDGVDLLAGPVRLHRPPRPPLEPVAIGERIGISRAVDHPWRFWLAGNPFVSRA